MDSNINHMHALKIIKRFYLIINQYLDKNVIDIDHRNKPFGNDADLIIGYDDFLSFFHSNDDDFYKLSFLKCDILSDHVSIKKRFKIDKLKISNSFKKIDSNYLNKIINIKSKSIDLKSVISFYDLFINIGKINSYRHLDFENDLGYLKKTLNNQDLIGVKSKIDLNFYLNKIKI